MKLFSTSREFPRVAVSTKFHLSRLIRPFTLDSNIRLHRLAESRGGMSNLDDNTKQGNGGAIKNVTSAYAGTLDTLRNVGDKIVIQPTKIANEQVSAFNADIIDDVRDLQHQMIHPVVAAVKHTKNETKTKPNTPTPTTGIGYRQSTKHHGSPKTIDMFAKTASTLFCSVIVYALADLRNLVRDHRDQVIGDPATLDQFITLPITDVQVLVFVFENLKLLQSYMKEGEIDYYVEAVKRYRSELANKAQKSFDKIVAQHENQQEQDSSVDVPSQEPPLNKQQALRPRGRQRRRSIFESVQQKLPNTLEVFDDENSLKELVYGITVNRERRQITISFRGSVTAKDWLIDCKFFLTNVPNPLRNQVDGNGSERKFSIPQSKNVSIHAGFYDYLFSPQTKGGECKYSKILKNLRMILDKEPTLQSYSLNATGHSLGGALATLFTFFLVCDRSFELPPTMDLACITFASPKCGNIKFARAFQELEIQKKFICIRVANHRDLITERPDRLTCWTFCLQDAIFRHVGIEILLFPDSQQQKNKDSDNHKKYRITYPRIRRSRIRQLTDDFTVSLLHTFQCTASVTCGCCIHDYMQWHSCDEYLNRVENIEAALQSLPVESIHNAYYNLVSEESETFTLPIKLPSNRTS